MGRAMSERFTVGGICRRFVGAMCEEFTGRDVREICGGDVRGDVQGVVQAKYRFRSRENIFYCRKIAPARAKIISYRQKIAPAREFIFLENVHHFKNSERAHRYG